MKKVLVWALLAAGGGTAYWYSSAPKAKPAPPEILRAAVSRGSITQTVQAMGIIEPRRRVNVGSQVSGVVKELYVDFNSVVTEGQLLAEIEPTMYEVQVQVQEAVVARQLLDIENQERQLADLKRQLARVQELVANDLQNQVQLDAAQMAVTMREAQINSLRKQLVQANAALDAARLNLQYTKIYAPIDGVVVNRNVSKGQTVQASVRTPNFFLLASPLETVRITAGVDEADIGRIRPGMPVKFRVATFGQELFSGVVDAVRLNASNTNYVVTYPVWIRVPNDELRLRPGMTATVFIEVSSAVETATRIPNEALRFRPTRDIYTALGIEAPAIDTVRQVDLDAERPIEPVVRKPGSEDEATTIDELLAPMPRPEAKATVWRWNEASREFTSVPVRVGVSDGAMTELLSGDVNVGDELVTKVLLPNARRSSMVGEERKAGLPPMPGRGGGRGGGGRGGD